LSDRFHCSIAGFYVDDHDYWDDIWCSALANGTAAATKYAALSAKKAWSSTELSRCSAEVLFRLGMKNSLPTSVAAKANKLSATKEATAAVPKVATRARGGDAAQAFLSACAVDSGSADSQELLILASLPSACSCVDPSDAAVDDDLALRRDHNWNAGRNSGSSRKEDAKDMPPAVEILRALQAPVVTDKDDSNSQGNVHHNFTVSGLAQSTLADGQRRTSMDLLRPILLAQEKMFRSTAGSNNDSGRVSSSSSKNSDIRNHASLQPRLTILSGAPAAKLLWRGFDSNGSDGGNVNSIAETETSRREGSLWDACGVELVDGRLVLCTMRHDSPVCFPIILSKNVPCCERSQRGMG